MNLGWYELLDRIHLIQNAIQENVYEHQQTDAELQRMLDTAQESLSDAYQYAGKMFDESWEQKDNQLTKEEK